MLAPRFLTALPCERYTGAAHIVKLVSSDATRLCAGPVALLAQLLAAELPAAGRARYPPPPPPPLLRMSGLFVALGVADHLRARLEEAAEYVKPRAGRDGAPRTPLQSVLLCLGLV